MKKRFMGEQIVAMIKEQEAGEKTADICRRNRISSSTSININRSTAGRNRRTLSGCVRLKMRMVS